MALTFFAHLDAATSQHPTISSGTRQRFNRDALARPTGAPVGKAELPGVEGDAVDLTEQDSPAFSTYGLWQEEKHNRQNQVDR
jgi:hypothetical protein